MVIPALSAISCLNLSAQILDIGRELTNRVREVVDVHGRASVCHPLTLTLDLVGDVPAHDPTRDANGVLVDQALYNRLSLAVSVGW